MRTKVNMMVGGNQLVLLFVFGIVVGMGLMKLLFWLAPSGCGR